MLHAPPADDSESRCESDLQNAVPLVVVINGAEGVPGRKKWELLYRKIGYEGAAALQRQIDSINTSGPPPGEPGR